MNGPARRRPPAGRRPGPDGRRPPPGRRAAPPPAGRRPTGSLGRRPTGGLQKGPAPAPEAAAPRSFEIRKGRATDDETADWDAERPLAQVALPQSITQEEEAERLRKRLGRESVPDLTQRDQRVLLHTSVGATGPDRYIRRRLLYLGALLGLAALAAAYWALFHPGGPRLLGGG